MFESLRELIVEIRSRNYELRKRRSRQYGDRDYYGGGHESDQGFDKAAFDAEEYSDDHYGDQYYVDDYAPIHLYLRVRKHAHISILAVYHTPDTIAS